VTLALQSADLRVSLGGREVLHGIDLKLPAGRWTAVAGPNGAGKTTLLKALAQLLPAQGRVQMLGRDATAWSARERARALAWLGQGDGGAEDLLARDVVMLGRLPHQDWLGAASVEDHAAVRAAMEETQSWDWRERPLGELSGGERQRVLLARALAVAGAAAADGRAALAPGPAHQADWLAIVRRHVARGGTALSVLHEISMALQADDLVLLARGRIVHHGALQGSDDPSRAGKRVRRAHRGACGGGALGRAAGRGVTREGALRDGARHQQRRRQELAGHRAVPLVRAPGPEGGAVQGAEHEQQRPRGGHAGRRAGRDRQRPVLPGAGGAGRADVRMNPVLLKPERDDHSQVVLLGQVDAALGAMPWRAAAPTSGRTWPARSMRLRARNDVVVIEGAGSPAEINLHDSDFVNMRVALHAAARCLLVTDIDRGGAFAHLYGTWALLVPEERALLHGFVLNKFRGDAALLAPGPRQLQELTGVPTLAVLPMWREHGLPEEDGVFDERGSARGEVRLTVAVVAYPRISNLDEFQPLKNVPGLRLRWVRTPAELAGADWIVLPGSKHTSGDLEWLRAQGLDRAIAAHAERGGRVLGVCGGCRCWARRWSTRTRSTATAPAWAAARW
jgi:ABC-type cobalamin/Fe3+-siderophores transport system ATPase subunit